ncbi:glycerophosphodiester phosphodiesterase [Leptolyngbyaceae cyanobacterium CCMR0082]|uniref:Glycerophosphodiester phosphodiesterase n=2 Tax=Adonisia TaxID=2950183 RepID=A0A6M0S0I2_9CYAN|nr:glycerophosphodiester phosphodiesterase [Adonisia turfae CCMR0082]
MTIGCCSFMVRKRRKFQKLVAIVLMAAIGFLYFSNASFWVKPIGLSPVLVAHRGLSQGYDRQGLTNDTCTAARMLPVPHDYLENTLPSMKAAFDYGADIVELDVHPTTDGHFAVFHDWTIDCRTNGAGVTREQTLDSLQALDIGYGYTVDGGKTYPFRGRGVGMMPSLEEVFNAFPDRNFVINVKSQDPKEGELLAERLAMLPPERQAQFMVYGADQPTSIIREQFPTIRTLWPRRLKQCLIRYVALGWTGWVPDRCDRNMLLVPANVAPWLWGWPNRFLQRMHNVGTKVFLVGDYNGEGFSQGFDDPERLQDLPATYAGGIWTDRIDLIGPAVHAINSSD